ncbi:hypothetical protein NGB36_03870 [Streptomyces sp. RB6PN25]|uniref:Uncharacterized protein n=1 Tax=Streptomyces humicola TaxID=2953240 RepID=A0ABT1PQ02_9ACTN|nr:hypothetical protein [Streptomyces humicola]MCQ4079752.1 hypothetical protein [Streptomyces humicola]
MANTGNIVTPLNFSGKSVEAELVQNATDFRVQGRNIVINLGMSGIPIGEAPGKAIPPLSSTILVDTTIEQADSLVLLRTKPDSISVITGEPGWSLLADLPPGSKATPFPKDIPLWKSPQDDAGRITFDPAVVLEEATAPEQPQEFQIKVNLWFAPAGTDCAIHNQHDFIEVHTQVHGTGRMQKFRAQDPSTHYEDILMSPGYTTPDPFCSTGPDGTFIYPWHQYHADTDCVWLAVEYHAQAS